MTTSKLTDANLSRDVYTVNNTSGGTVDGWTRVKVEEFRAAATVSDGSNFAAQLYKNNDGSYKIAFRGTASLTGSGDLIANKSGIVMNQWPAELSRGVDFVLGAIRQIQAEMGGTFAQAAARLTLTGHSQGGWESQVHSKLFNLIGTGFDSPGALSIVGTPEYRKELERLRQLEPEYGKFDSPLKGFTVRQYTFVVGGVDVDIPGTVSDRSYLALGAALWTLSNGGPLVSGVAQALLHRINNIVEFERARLASPLLRWVAGDGSNQGELAVALAAPWTRVLVGGTVQPSAGQVAELVNDFLAGQRGEQLTVRQAGGTLLVESSTGDALLIRPDGSGSSVSTNGIHSTERFFSAGAVPVMTVQMQRDDDGNTMAQVTQAGQRTTFLIGPDGEPLKALVQPLDDDGNVLDSVFVDPMPSKWRRPDPFAPIEERNLEEDYIVLPNGKIITTSGNPAEFPRGPIKVFDEFGQIGYWDPNHPGSHRPNIFDYDDPWRPRGDTPYTGALSEGEDGPTSASISEAFARAIQSISAFSASQPEYPRRRTGVEPAPEAEPSAAPLRPDRRRGGMWAWEP